MDTVRARIQASSLMNRYAVSIVSVETTVKRQNIMKIIGSRKSGSF